MCNKIYKYLIIWFAFVCGFVVFNSNKIEASYKFCDQRIAGTEYYDCGYYIYTYYEDTLHSTMIYSTSKDKSILYMGEKDGISIFIAQGFRLYNRSYDDRSNSNNNLWSVLSKQGKVVYDGSFKDSWLVDDSHEGYYRNTLLDEIYTIRQYTNNGELYRTIVIYNVEQGEIKFNTSYYDNNILLDNEINEVVESTNKLNINLISNYGIKNVEVKINNKLINSAIIGNSIQIYASTLNANLIRGEINKVEVSVKNYLGAKKSNTYKILLVNNNVSIKFDTITSINESSSRRFVISAIAGKGKTLDTDYCWYYWSTSPDDSLLYDDFLKNYANSSYKGSYSEDKGVILRNTSGTYYLYALAKDDNSYVVIKSDGYVLNNQGYKVYYSIADFILIVTLLIICVIPISIYLYVRKKGY